VIPETIVGRFSYKVTRRARSMRFNGDIYELFHRACYKAQVLSFVLDLEVIFTFAGEEYRVRTPSW